MSIDLQTLVGMTETKAKAKIRAANMTVRVRQRDDQYFMGTTDFRTNRINLFITKGKVTKATIG